jgi:hypothetical protein
VRASRVATDTKQTPFRPGRLKRQSISYRFVLHQKPLMKIHYLRLLAVVANVDATVDFTHCFVTQSTGRIVSMEIPSSFRPSCYSYGNPPTFSYTYSTCWTVLSQLYSLPPVVCSNGDYGNRPTFVCPDFSSCTQSDWYSLAGYQQNTNTTVCEPCPVDSFKSIDGPDACQPCSTLYASDYSTRGAQGSTQCFKTCPVGSYMNGTVCVTCPQNAICTGTTNTWSCVIGFEGNRVRSMHKRPIQGDGREPSMLELSFVFDISASPCCRWMRLHVQSKQRLYSRVPVFMQIGAILQRCRRMSELSG